MMPDTPVAPAPGAKNFKTHCIHGHSLDDAYLVTHWYKGKNRVMRLCRPCQVERAAKQRRKSKANSG